MSGEFNRDRLVTIIDEAFGMQPVMDDEQLLTLLESRLYQMRVEAEVVGEGMRRAEAGWTRCLERHLERDAQTATPEECARVFAEGEARIRADERRLIADKIDAIEAAETARRGPQSREITESLRWLTFELRGGLPDAS